MKAQQQQANLAYEQRVQWREMKRLKQLILNIRDRKKIMPKVPDPTIVISFDELYSYKSNQIRKKIIKKKIQEKQKQFHKINSQLEKFKQKYIEKQKSFKQKQHILQVLSKKLQIQYQKTKTTFRQVGFNRSFTSGVRKLDFYKIGQILFNDYSRRLFSMLQCNQQHKDPFQGKTDQQVGICLGYLGLLISIIGLLSDSRVWFDFVFKGSKSSVRLNDGTHVILRPKQHKFQSAMNVMSEQASQILHQCFDISIIIQKSKNYNQFFQICQQLSKNIIG